MPYESGMDPVGHAKERYSIAFYLVAMEFIVFDLEVVFIYPWAVRFMEHSAGTFFAMFIFIIILFIGLVYTLRKGTLDRSEEHTSELQSRGHLVCRLLLEKKKVIEKDDEL